MHKKILYSNQARRALQKGVDKLANAVKVTLGPRGKAVVFRRAQAIFSLDGVTVAKQISFADEAENMGAELVQDVASKTDKEAGDGTTTATILAQSILAQGLKALSAGIDHTKLKKGIDEGLLIAKKVIKTLAKPIKTRKEVADVATISSRDAEIGNLVADVVEKLGKDAVITVEESKVMGLHSEIVEGMQLNKGFIAPHFLTNVERGEVVLEEPRVLVTSQVISANQDIVKILESIYSTEKRCLCIIADNVRGEALATLVINKLKGILSVAAIMAPGYGDDKREQLEDVAILTGATVLAEEKGQKLEDAALVDLGMAEKIVITKDSTIIVGGKGKTSEIKKRVAQIKKEIEDEKSDFERELRVKRLGKLKGGVAVIKIGTISEQENMEKRYRIEDAVKAAKSSLEEGIVSGAGMALIQAAKEIGKRIESEKDFSFRMGLEILAEAMREPARQIILNTGEQPDVILHEVAKMGPNAGYDSATGEYRDNLIEQGIIDPAKVARCALENAVSVSSLFLITEAAILDEQEKPTNKD